MRVPARVGVLVLLLVATACGRTPVPERSPAASGSPPQSPEPAPAKVLDFEAQKLGGGVLRGSDYVGKDMALWFWAPW